MPLLNTPPILPSCPTMKLVSTPAQTVCLDTAEWLRRGKARNLGKIKIERSGFNGRLVRRSIPHVLLLAVMYFRSVELETLRPRRSSRVADRFRPHRRTSGRR